MNLGEGVQKILDLKLPKGNETIGDIVSWDAKNFSGTSMKSCKERYLQNPFDQQYALFVAEADVGRQYSIKLRSSWEKEILWVC